MIPVMNALGMRYAKRAARVAWDSFAHQSRIWCGNHETHERAPTMEFPHGINGPHGMDS